MTRVAPNHSTRDPSSIQFPGNGQRKPAACSASDALALARCCAGETNWFIQPRLGRGGGIGVGSTPMTLKVAATKSQKPASAGSAMSAASASLPQHPHRQISQSTIMRAAKPRRCGCRRQLANRSRPSCSFIIEGRAGHCRVYGFILQTPRIRRRMVTIRLKLFVSPAGMPPNEVPHSMSSLPARRLLCLEPEAAAAGRSTV